MLLIVYIAVQYLNGIVLFEKMNSCNEIMSLFQLPCQPMNAHIAYRNNICVYSYMLSTSRVCVYSYMLSTSRVCVYSYMLSTSRVCVYSYMLSTSRVCVYSYMLSTSRVCVYSYMLSTSRVCVYSYMLSTSRVCVYSYMLSTSRVCREERCCSFNIFLGRTYFKVDRHLSIFVVKFLYRECDKAELNQR